MTTEIDRRWLLVDKLHETSNVAIEQKDWPEVSRLMSTRLRLIVRNIQAIELKEPGFITYLLQQKEGLEMWESLGITNRDCVEAILRGRVDPWSRQ